MITWRDRLSAKFWCNLDLILLVLLGVYILAFNAGVITLVEQRNRALAHQMIECPEDCVLVGQGEFDKGYWTRYFCIPWDDIAAGEYIP